MATILLPTEFQELLKLFHENNVEYLLIGGYAVGYHGYPRATGDMDIWIALEAANAERISSALQGFGFSPTNVPASIFLEPNRVFRMGTPPLRIELLTSISGVLFPDCWAKREVFLVDGLPVNLIDAGSLKANKAASGRLTDLNDLENLP